ncbi:MAG: cytochrome c-type biogenesis protein CcmH [Flavobacteriales bacterium]|jgi:cytochrome c-type biogenesis protein CcmH
MGSHVYAGPDIVEFDTGSQRLRYIDLTAELRCPKCQNQSLQDSDSEISQAMRRVIAKQLIEGKSDKEIKQFMVNRYSNYVLYKPPLNSRTWLLWAAPYLMLFAGTVIFIVTVVRRSRKPRIDNKEGLSD